MSDLQPRPYADDDLPVLQDIVAGWIAVAGRCAYDHIGELPHRIYENLRGRRPIGELVQVWEERGAVMGITINLRFGAAFDAFVAPALRGTAAEAAMLRHAAYVTDHAAADDEEFVLTDCFDCDTVRAGLLSELGFERFRTWDTVNSLSLSSAEAAPAEVEGFEIRPAVYADAKALAVAHNGAFGDDWTGESYRAEVMDKPGYDPAHEIVAVTPDGKIAAFCVYWNDPLNKLGHFEPVGTHPDYQRRGLGKAVMAYALREMAADGMSNVTVNHNAENSAAAALYASLGFAPVGSTSGYRRPRGASREIPG
ncbi:MAG: GNAT family N-acetyltransferase [Hamadaea sp.]|uniref:GNAT family N-acetyltransferase n=1 Tax=Hamadaea sp. TaxID=2024425 RepID=UPI0018332B63|nr:GNAT family N-acetyltransferase [Hamadaea sp.]NUR73146.1 GNAT family N-acetyltransferase [Hamadaea sp.]NUT18488.1 GNAT family N-acetyltransferase [Hamadaea sp.]